MAKAEVGVRWNRLNMTRLDNLYKGVSRAGRKKTQEKEDRQLHYLKQKINRNLKRY